MILLTRGEHEKALEHAERAIGIAGNEPEFQDTVARVYEATGHHERAAACLERARRMAPGNLKWYVPLAEALIRAEQPEQALKVVEDLDVRRGQGLRIPPDHKERLKLVRQALAE